MGAYPAEEKTFRLALREGWNPRGATRLQPVRLPVHRTIAASLSHDQLQPAGY